MATSDNVVQAVIGSQAITQPVDKIISTILAFLVGMSIPVRYRPPFGRQVLPE
jgi:hypothetical protein